MSTMTRGPLSPRVYWRRRGLAVLIALTLVFVFARVLGGGSDASDGTATDGAVAQQAAAEPSRAPASAQATGKAKNKKSRKAKPTPTPLAEPSGPCVDADLNVTPVVPVAVAGSGVPIVLQLRTTLTQACTWGVSSDRVTLKITSGGDDVWSSLDCPGAVPVQDVVVRREVTSTVGLVWGGKRSDEGCTGLTDWALPGTYEVVAAALGGEPWETTFELTSPDPEVIVTTPKPAPDKNKKKNKAKQKKKRNQNQN